MNNNFTMHDINIDNFFESIRDELEFTLKNFSTFYSHDPRYIDVLNSWYGIDRDQNGKIVKNITWDLYLKDTYHDYSTMYRVVATENGLLISDTKANVSMNSKKLDKMLKEYIELAKEKMNSREELCLV